MFMLSKQRGGMTLPTKRQCQWPRQWQWQQDHDNDNDKKTSDQVRKIIRIDSLMI